MLKSSAGSVIRLRGVRHNNLKNFDLDLPLKKLIVITGLSGSGKSSLAFDTLFAEGQRRYIETFSPYARQFFDRMDKPQVDSIEGIPPAIAIEQRNAVRTTRSTVRSDLDLPLKKLIVITGLSGSGKSSLAFDTLFAEGQRRYIETFSPYARQFFDRMDKPQVDSIEGIPPAIAIEQRNAVRTTRSTV